MTLQQLIYFKEVADTLHFTKAAQNLYITQSALSYAISVLERELGQPLFVRESGKSISLTTFGSALLPLVNKAIEDFGEIEDAVRRLRNPLSGEVNVAYSFINGSGFVPEMFGSFRTLEAFSDIKINFSINYQRVHFETACVRGEQDLVFSSAEQTDGLESVLFARQHLCAVMPATHALADKQSVTIEELADEQLIGYNQYDNQDNWIRDMYRSQGLKPNFTEYCSDWLDQLSQVALGNGIAIMARTAISPDFLRFVPIDDEMCLRGIYLMWSATRKLSPAVEYVRDCCLNFYSEPPVV